MLLPAAGATAQAREDSSSVALDPTAISSGRQLNSRAADACSVAKAGAAARRPGHPASEGPVHPMVARGDRGEIDPGADVAARFAIRSQGDLDLPAPSVPQHVDPRPPPLRRR